ncbi:MAG: PTS galactitol transporter subunit IIC [Spirochaetes bacterium]|jgi:PTS system galactitol-specific IIC component|nr:PTS galactitol transporter subunit IIC [Spirochaetota bacterium]
MNTLNSALQYFLSFEPYVMLPIIIFIMALVFRIKTTIALKSALTLGIAFIGIFMTFDFFVKIINPVMQAIIIRSGLNLPVLDTGWPPLAGITWSYSLAPLLLVIFMTINIIMLVSRLTKTVNIDIWNYWHPIFLAALVHHTTGNAWLAIATSAAGFIFTLKLAEWSAPLVNKLTGMDGICIPHLSGIIHYPIASVINAFLDRIPGIRSIKADPEHMRKKLGLLGEPMVLGIIIGLLLGIAGGYEVRELLNLAFGFAAVVFILPKMGEILGSALIPISEGMKLFITRKFSHLGTTYIGLDVAVLFAVPAVLVTALLLIPVSIILAIILPGVNFIPIGDLTNLLVPVAIITVATKGNIVKSFIIGIPVVIINLYYASMFAPVVTDMARESNFKIEGYDGLFTSFLDGGNPFRSWVVLLLQGDILSIALVPVVIGMVFLTWKISRKENRELLLDEPGDIVEENENP